jgi:hypothetical protein
MLSKRIVTVTEAMITIEIILSDWVKYIIMRQTSPIKNCIKKSEKALPFPG